MADKPLHNFTLPNPSLKWNTEGSSVNNRRTMRSPTPRPALHPSLIRHHSEPVPDHVPFKLSASEEEASDGLEYMDDRPLIEHYNKKVARIGRGDAEKVEKKGVRGEGEDEAKKPRIKIKLPCKNIEGVKGKDVVMVDARTRDVRGKEKEVVMKAEKDKKVTDSIDGINEGVKLWNLRPRADKGKISNLDRNQAQASKEKDVWARLNLDIALTPKEIEDDLIAMGVKPSTSRKVQKRQKSLQNIIDRISPGNNLRNISADTYHVSANSMKV